MSELREYTNKMSKDSISLPENRVRQLEVFASDLSGLLAQEDIFKEAKRRRLTGYESISENIHFWAQRDLVHKTLKEIKDVDSVREVMIKVFSDYKSGLSDEQVEEKVDYLLQVAGGKRHVY